MSFYHLSALQRPRYRFDNGLQLNGTTQYGRVQNVNGEALPAGWSLLLTLRPLRQPASIEVVFNNSVTNSNGWSVRLIYDATYPAGWCSPHLYSFNSGGGVVKLAGALVKVGEVCQVLVTKVVSGGNTVLRLYVNGVLSATYTGTACSALSAWSTVTSGTSHGALLGILLAGSYPQIRLGELDLIGGALAADDAARLWNGGRGSYWRDTGLASIASEVRYKFDETSGTPAYDSSGTTPGTPRHLVLVNSPTFAPL